MISCRRSFPSSGSSPPNPWSASRKMQRRRSRSSGTWSSLSSVERHALRGTFCSFPRREPSLRDPEGDLTRTPHDSRTRRSPIQQLLQLLTALSLFLLWFERFGECVVELRLPVHIGAPPKRSQIPRELLDFLMAQRRRSVRRHLRIRMEANGVLDEAVHPRRGMFEADVGELRRVGRIFFFRNRGHARNLVTPAALLPLELCTPCTLSRRK